MKIQLKRSNVLDGGQAKEPTAAQMEYGELAVNYSDTDPAIFLKDSADNIIRISGVGNISDDGQVEVPSTVNPPLNPSDGNLWYNADDGRLYVYYNDGNSSQWVDASPDGWNEQEALGGYVEKAGDNMTGDLTLGTDKVVLDAAAGTAVFNSSVTASAFIGDGSALTGLTVNPGTLPIASTTQAGIVQLEDANNSTSTSTAATANANKAAYDRGSLGVTTAAAADTKAAAAQSTADTAVANAATADGKAVAAQDTANTAKSTADAALPKVGGTISGSLTVNGTIQGGSYSMASLPQI